MKHLQKALDSFSTTKIGDKNFTDFITAKDNILTINIQDGTIPLAGVNGLQITNVLEYVSQVYKSLNLAFPCDENDYTINMIDLAIAWQYERTKQREKRDVDGKDEL